MVKASSLTMIVAPRSICARLARSAAGFMATSTLGVSPGVAMSREAKWIWKLETPARLPAGARISAGKLGSVARSLPNTAVASVKRPPASCIPSPESPGEAHDDAFAAFDLHVAVPGLRVIGDRGKLRCGHVVGWLVRGRESSRVRRCYGNDLR